MRLLAGLALLLLLFTPTRATARITKARALHSGQVTSYGAAGDTSKGVARSYVDFGNGVIKDQKTGLFWEKKSDDGSIHDKDFVFSWSGASSVIANGTAFSQFLSALNTPPCFGGYCDWRLPTVTEMLTLVDFAHFSPSVGIAFNDGCAPGCSVATCSCTLSAGYWTATTVEYVPNAAWVLFFINGTLDGFDKTQLGRLRAVRGGTP